MFQKRKMQTVSFKIPLANTVNWTSLHNNAGILVVGDVTTIPETDWDRCIDINLKSVYLVSKYAIPAMQRTGGGVVINTASTAGMSGGGGYSVYGASKAAIILLTQCMASGLRETQHSRQRGLSRSNSDTDDRFL